ncbi:hypothetical protein CHU93_03750 [Sandarakinorhabdus cyanobacteriorum]|uniref:Uncharacterized protein n=1 Tax=Sandarakinorhabdus cyanobacteriorum TaxID=1981098 RepID=A0A255YTR1_9SPHN|nr:hypothetical protein [Sandarakinorhabdus cyanobacteriorum]OYQ32025.1 hypothetical protein CHU93_03750 [Sandarakinorhabdus cyanobacteriorum]
MDISFWDGVLRGGTMVLLALLAWNFGKGWRAALTARLGVLLCVAGLGYLYLPALPAAYNFAWWRMPLHLAGMASPGLFWLFAQSWFDDDFQLRPWHGLAVAALVVAGATSSYFGVSGGWPRLALILTWPLPNAIFTALGVAAALRGRDNDLVELRRRVRLVLALTIGLAILVIVGAELLAPGWPPPGW